MASAFERPGLLCRLVQHLRGKNVSAEVYAVAANHTHTTGDRGGGVFKPDGSALAKLTLTKPNIVFAEVS